jgi:hypothetical protein
MLRCLPGTFSAKEILSVETVDGDFEVLELDIQVSDSVFWKMRKHNTETLTRLFPYPIRILVGRQLYVVSGKKVLIPAQNLEYEVSNLLRFRFYELEE